MALSRSRVVLDVWLGLPLMYTVGAESEWTVKLVVALDCVATRPFRLPDTSPFCAYVHGTLTPSQLDGVGGPAIMWSPSSEVKTKTLFERLMPSLASRAKNLANASS